MLKKKVGTIGVVCHRVWKVFGEYVFQEKQFRSINFSVDNYRSIMFCFRIMIIIEI